MKMLWFLLTLVFLCGCSFSTVKTNPEAFYKSEVGLKWPAPPSKPRYELIKIINSVEDFKKNIKVETRTEKFIKWLIGEESENFLNFGKPFAIFVKDDVIYIVDQGILGVITFDLKTARVGVLKDTKEGDMLFYPTSVCVDDDNNVYVTDPEKKRIVIYDKNGYPVSTKTLDNINWRPSGIAFSERKRNFYVADSLNHDVKVFDRDFKLIKTIGRRGEADGEFNFPTHLFVDDEKSLLFVTDTMNFRVQVLDLEGRYISKIGRMGIGDGNFARPKGVCTDKDGNIYVIDSLQDSIQVFNKDDRLLAVLGEEGVMPGQFNLPTGIFIDKKNYIYIADSLNRRIQIIKYLGEGS